MTPGMLSSFGSFPGLDNPFDNPPAAPSSTFIRSVDSILAAGRREEGQNVMGLAQRAMSHAPTASGQ